MPTRVKPASAGDGLKAVIINGDDFGFSREVNAAIVRAHREGILTSASLMTTGAARDEAASLAHENPSLDVGLHLVVCKGTSALAPAHLDGIVDSAGRFVENPVLGGMRYFFNRSIRTMLADECRAQIELHLKLIGYLNHIDGHLNFHAHPVLADILIDLAAEYRVPCLRLPREPILATLALARDNLGRKLLEAVIFKSLSARMRRKMAERGLKTTDCLFGLHQSGNLSEAYVLGVIDHLRDGVTEIYFHPAVDIGATPPSASAQREVEILTSPRVRAALEAKRVNLTTFRDLARGAI
jgi:hopanoid biosynthesis associated protein HpnK